MVTKFPQTQENKEAIANDSPHLQSNTIPHIQYLPNELGRFLSRLRKVS